MLAVAERVAPSLRTARALRRARPIAAAVAAAACWASLSTVAAIAASWACSSACWVSPISNTSCSAPSSCIAGDGALRAATTIDVSCARICASLIRLPCVNAGIRLPSSSPASTPASALSAKCRRQPSSWRGTSGNARANASKKRPKTGA
jgi:hypothetical protein